MALFLDEAVVRRLLTMGEAMDVVEAAFRDRHGGSAINIGRRRIVMESGSLSVMAAGLPSIDVMAVKAYTAFGTAGARHLLLLYSTRDGSLLAVIEADWLGRVRTGAATGLATAHLARVDASRLALIGTGGQAWSQVEAICRVRPLQEVKIYSPSPDHRTAFAKRVQTDLGVAATAVARARQAVEGADIVTTVTSATEPVLLGEWLAAGTHVNAVGSNWDHRREVDDGVVSRAAFVVVDALDEAQREAGDLIQPARRGLLDWGRVYELSDYIGGHRSGRRPDDVTLYKSVGIAIEDVAVAARVYQLARHQGVGKESPIAGS